MRPHSLRLPHQLREVTQPRFHEERQNWRSSASRPLGLAARGHKPNVDFWQQGFRHSVPRVSRKKHLKRYDKELNEGHLRQLADQYERAYQRAVRLQRGVEERDSGNPSTRVHLLTENI